MSSPLRVRLLQDIAEIQTQPYPNIALHIQDEDISTGCLILTVKGYGPMHLTIEFNSDYPLTPPTIRMDSKVTHPNIKDGGHICASILDTKMDYTSAYTLKGIAIQLLSFFSSDRIQQVGGDFFFTLEDFRNLHIEQSVNTPPYGCEKCQFGTPSYPSEPIDQAPPDTRQPPISNNGTAARAASQAANVQRSSIETARLPDEMLLLICDLLETEDLMSFAGAWSSIADVIIKYNVIRSRELRCFCLKTDYVTAKLGVGIALKGEEKGNMPLMESEFDLLSEEAFDLGVRRSVQGVQFRYWLPLPISEGHWDRVRDDVDTRLSLIARAAGLGNIASVGVIFKFLNDIIVKLSKENEEITYRSPVYPYEEKPKSTLKHASEKAIESYFHIFHLLLCKAAEEPSILNYANHIIHKFANGATHKDQVPNLGQLLIAMLISDIEISTKIIQNLITEAITRNAKRVLEKYPELAYLEPTPFSNYRLEKSFEASKTSYRILMFLNLFRRIAIGTPRKTIQQLRDSAFSRHGAPPPGGAKDLAESIKNIHKVDNFGDFLALMGMPRMNKDWVSKFLKERQNAAVTMGYCSIPLTQGQAMYLRAEVEPNIAVVPGTFFLPPPKPDGEGRYDFRARRGGRGGSRGGRGRGR